MPTRSNDEIKQTALRMCEILPQDPEQALSELIALVAIATVCAGHSDEDAHDGLSAALLKLRLKDCLEDLH